MSTVFKLFVLQFYIPTMVYTCSSCGRKYAKACGFAFFSFPKNQFVRTAWLKFCGLDLHSANDTSTMKLCSEHFEKSSFRITRKDGPLILKPNAIPTLFGRNSTPSAKSVTNIEMQRAVSMNQSVKRKLLYVNEEQKSIPGSSSEINLTANRQLPFVAECNASGSSFVKKCKQERVECTTTVTPMKKKPTWGPRHGMDMSPSHFSTPRKARRNLLIIKEDIKKRDKRIKQLYQINYRMKKKINSLEHFIEHLKSK